MEPDGLWLRSIELEAFPPETSQLRRMGRESPRVSRSRSRENNDSNTSSSRESRPRSTIVLTTSVGVRYWPNSLSSTNESMRNWPNTSFKMSSCPAPRACRNSSFGALSAKQSTNSWPSLSSLECSFNSRSATPNSIDSDCGKKESNDSATNSRSAAAGDCVPWRICRPIPAPPVSMDTTWAKSSFAIWSRAS